LAGAFSARPGGFSDGFSIWDILSGDISADIFADSIVLIGPYTVGLQDIYVTPIDPRPMHGVEIHANAIDAMVRGEFRQPMATALSVVLTAGILMLLFMVFYFWHPILTAVVLIVVSGGWLLLGRMLVFPSNPDWFLFGELSNLRFQLPPLFIPLGAVVLYVSLLVVNFVTSQRQKRQVTDMFKKYVDPAIIDDIFETGLDNLQLGGSMENICVMFVDLRGFTPMSEILTPPEVVSLLNEYLEMTSSAIFKHKGTLDKFMGDATMAFWGAPVQQDDITYKAVLAAWDIVQDGLKMEAMLSAKYGVKVGFGIGLNLGEAVVGNIGSMQRVDYTAIGNTVNTAARLESNAKPGQILLSESVYRELKDRITVRLIGNIPLKGKSEELTVYALEHIKEYEGTFEPLASAQLPAGK
jgi:adenylate cyclase